MIVLHLPPRTGVNSGSLFFPQLAYTRKYNPSLALVVGRNYFHGCLIRNNEMKLRKGNFRMNVRKTFLTARDFKL